jgi:hypothetical protein
MQETVQDILRIAKDNKIKITRIAKYVQCSRASLYNWQNGGDVIDVFRYRLEALHTLLAQAENPKEAFDVAYTNQ